MKLDDNPGLAIIRKGEGAIQKGIFQLTHRINLQTLELTIREVEILASSLEKRDFKKILETKTFALKRAFSNLMPKKRQKRSWEALGSFIKWTAGNPDAEDARIINKELDKLNSGQQDIIEKQTENNRIFEDKINEIIRTLKELVNKNQDEIFDSLKIINLIFNIDTVKEKIEDINLAIIQTKANLVAKGILTEEELHFIYEKLAEQNINVNSLQETFPFLKPKIEYLGQTILYKIQIPQIESGFTQLLTEPIPIDGKEIQTRYKEVLTKGNKTYATTQKCIENKILLCTHQDVIDISEDACISALVRQKHGNCTFKEKTPTRITVMDNGNILIKNTGEPITIYNTCGTANYTVISNTLVNFKNCSITLQNETFENSKNEFDHPTELLDLFNIKILQTKKHLEIHELSEFHLNSKEKIENMGNQQKIDRWINYTISTIIILSMITGAIIAWRYKSSRDEMKLRPEELPNGPQTSSTNPTNPIQSLFQ